MKDEVNKTLKDFRDAAKLTQTELAQLMGMGLSAYQDLESGFSKFKAKHLMVLERVSLKLAVEREDLNLALPSIRRDALDFGRLAQAGGAASEARLEAYLEEVRGLVGQHAGVEVSGQSDGLTWDFRVTDGGRTLLLTSYDKAAPPPAQHVAALIMGWLDTVTAERV